VEGSGSIVEEIANASPDLRRFIAQGFSKMIEYADFDEALFGHLSQCLVLANAWTRSNKSSSTSQNLPK
jgi:hypothetical protein